MGDLAHAFRCEWRSLADLQQLVLRGRFGSKPNVLKPFENLKVLELQQELQARGIWDCDGGRKELQDTLADVGLLLWWQMLTDDARVQATNFSALT